MTPEQVEYYRAMLLVGFRDRFDSAFDRALETEEPLSDLILALSTCISDDNQVLSVLREYTLHHAYEEQTVYDMVVEDVLQRYHGGQMDRSQVVFTLQRIMMHREVFWVEPWHSLDMIIYNLELWEDGIVSEEAFNQCFDAYFFRGEKLDAWKFQAEQHKKPRKGVKLWHFLRRLLMN